MASSNTGRWVRRVGSAGGGRTYRRRRPINYYGVIVVICVLGVASVALARYYYQHPAGAVSSQSPPTTQDTWYAALGISVCGSQQPSLAPNPQSAATGFQAIDGGVIQVHPITASQTGSNATLAAFVKGYQGLHLTSDLLVLPATGKGAKQTTYVSGTTKCPQGTPDAGKVGQVEIAHWPNFSTAKATTTSSPGTVKFTPNQLITIGFLPMGSALPKPPETAIARMLHPPATTTTLGAVTTTIPVTTTSSAATTTTSHATTTTSNATTTTKG